MTNLLVARQVAAGLRVRAAMTGAQIAGATVRAVTVPRRTTTIEVRMIQIHQARNGKMKKAPELADAGEDAEPGVPAGKACVRKACAEVVQITSVPITSAATHVR